LVSALTMGEARAAPGVGLATLVLADPVGGEPMEAAVFYPAARPTGSTMVGPYRIDAERDAPASEEKGPLVVISHGHAGTRWGHHDLAERLAGEGITVAAIEHPGDNYRDQSGTGTERVIFGRPVQVSALVTAVLADRRFGPHLDPARIGVAGFSMGGYTALTLVGGRPNFERYRDYCRRYPDDRELCGFPDQPTPTAGVTLADPRIQAAFVMAPLAVFFGKDELAAIRVPVFLAYAEGDRVLLPAENAARIEPLLPTLVGRRVIPKAGHYAFLTPCPDEMTARFPDLCVDPPGVDRVAIHRTLDDDAVAFFRQVFSR
jgi:predicted dienelactone hydrolase